MEQNGITKKRVFGKGWFLTYPQCDLTKEALLDGLRGVGDIEEYVVCREAHHDGANHLHAFVKYSKKVEWKNKKFDVEDYHGNYQVAKCWQAVRKYCMKDGDFITNIDLEAALKKKGKHIERNMLIKNSNLNDLVDQGLISIMSVPTLEKAKQILALQQAPLELENTRGVWIYGPTGTGKSTYARTQYGNYYIKQQNKWFDGYIGQENIILEDLDSDCLAHYLKIWADKWGCSGEVKGGSVNLRHRQFVVTSNYSIEELFKDKDQELRNAIRRRFNVIKFD